MGKNNNLNDFLTDIADAIRTKKGTEDPINAQNFSTEISTISGMPDVPTLECYKMVGTEDNMDVFKTFVMENFVYNDNKSVLATSKWGIEGEEIIISGGSMLGFSGEWLGVQEIYILWYPNCMNTDSRDSWRESTINAGAEQITLSEWLSITAQAVNYREWQDEMYQ